MKFYDTKTGEITAPQFYAPCCVGMPFVVVLEGSIDQFAPVFSETRKLHEFMYAFRQQLTLPGGYTVLTVTRMREYCQTHVTNKVRIMLDPLILNPQHTRYNEIVIQDDKLFVRGESMPTV